MKMGIGYSPLTEKVYLGKQNKAKQMWVGEKTDITSDFINVLFEYIGENETRTIRGLDSGNENIFFNIKNNKEGIERAIKFLEKQKASK